MSTPTRTLPRPAVDLPPASGRYALRTECFPVELSTRVLGATVLRARFRPCAGALWTTADGEIRLSVEALTVSLRTSPRLLARTLRGPRGLHANQRWTARFACAESVAAGQRRFQLPGTVTVEEVTRDLVLDVRVVRSDDDGIVLHARGELAPPGGRRGDSAGLGLLGRLLVRNKLRVEIAGEFTR